MADDLDAIRGRDDFAQAGSSTLPPDSTARSTMTDPGAIAATIASVSRIGALRPGSAPCR